MTTKIQLGNSSIVFGSSAVAQSSGDTVIIQFTNGDKDEWDKVWIISVELGDGPYMLSAIAEDHDDALDAARDLAELMNAASYHVVGRAVNVVSAVASLIASANIKDSDCLGAQNE